MTIIQNNSKFGGYVGSAITTSTTNRHYILDTTGKLRNKAIEFLKEGRS